MTNQEIYEVLREQFPNGDGLFLQMIFEEIELYDRKNRDYASGKDGEAFDPNGNFNRVSKFFSMYPNISLSDPRVVCLAYIMKQMDQVAWSLSRGFDGTVEGLAPRLQDIAVYTNILKVINAHMNEEVAVEAAVFTFPNVPGVGWDFDPSGTVSISFDPGIDNGDPMVYNSHTVTEVGDEDIGT